MNWKHWDVKVFFSFIVRHVGGEKILADNFRDLKAE